MTIFLVPVSTHIVKLEIDFLFISKIFIQPTPNSFFGVFCFILHPLPPNWPAVFVYHRFFAVQY